MKGYTDNYLKVVFPATEEMIGKIVKVKITKQAIHIMKDNLLRL